MTAVEPPAAETPPLSRVVKVDALARVEGGGGLQVRIQDGTVREAELRSFEPPRFFEALLCGRSYADAPDIASRISGGGSVAYALGACRAMEAALGLEIGDPDLLLLRRLLSCGEWLRGHALHTHLFHAPDFLGCEDAAGLTRRYPGALERALGLKRLGNDILEAIGGRAVHPVNLRVGGFYKAPSREKLRRLIEPLKRAIDELVACIRLFAAFDFPDYEGDYTFLALHHPEEYAIGRGRIRTSRALDIAVAEFEEALGDAFCLGGSACMAGPLARYAINHQHLTPLCREMAGEAGLGPVVRNPFKSLIVRAIEMLYACQEALRLAGAYEEPARPALEIVSRPGRGSGCAETPRGLCYHRYDLDEDGRILAARIVSPDTLNRRAMEADLRGVAERSVDLSDEKLKLRCEQAIRNYDPCVSGGPPFLKVPTGHE